MQFLVPMENRNLRDLTDIATPLDHVKFHEHSQDEIHLAKIILLRQIVRESHRIRLRVTYTLIILLIFLLAGVLFFVIQ